MVFGRAFPQLLIPHSLPSSPWRCAAALPPSLPQLHPFLPIKCPLPPYLLNAVHTVLAAVVIMGDRLGLLNSLGLLIVIAGVLGYNWHKYQRMRSGHAVDTHHTQLSHKARASKRDDDTAGYSALEMEPLDSETPASCRVHSGSSSPQPKPSGINAAASGPSGGGGVGSDSTSNAGGFGGTFLSSGGEGMKEGLRVSPPSFQASQSSPVGAAPSSPGVLRVRSNVAGSGGDGGGLGLIPRPVSSPSYTGSGGGVVVLDPRRASSNSGDAIPLLSSGSSGRHTHLTLAYTPDLAEGVSDGSDLHLHHSHHAHLLTLASPTLTHRPTEGQPHG